MGSRGSDDGTRNGSTATSSLEEFREKYTIKKEYQKPSSFSAEESYFGDGRYPPDWGQKRTDIPNPNGGRRDAVLEYQNGRCARCATNLDDQDYYNCHHYRPISEGGTHELRNLVVLCGPCHKLIHPHNGYLDSDWREAPIFPAPDADPRVATIRKPVTDEEQEAYLPELELLELTSVEGENTFATSDATFAVSPTDAIEARDNLEMILDNVGLSPTHTLSIHVANSEHSPLFGADIELTLDLGEHGTCTMAERTDKYGEANFSIPAYEGAQAAVQKEGFETVTREIPLNDSSTDLTVQLTPISEESGASVWWARRSLLKVGAAAIGGVGIGRYIFGGSDTTAKAPSGAKHQQQTQSDNTSLPVHWTFDTETSAAVQSVKTTQNRIYLNTKVGTVRALSFDGSEQWTEVETGALNA